MERKSECDPVCPLVLCRTRRSSFQNKQNLPHNILCLFRKALLLLKKKRYQDQLLDKTENQISNLERMVNKTDLWEYCIWYVTPYFFLLFFLACLLKWFMNITSRTIFLLQVQDIEFAQIEMKVIEGLKVGNDWLKKMHEVHEKFIIFMFVLGTIYWWI